MWTYSVKQTKKRKVKRNNTNWHMYFVVAPVKYRLYAYSLIFKLYVQRINRFNRNGRH